jgi:pyridoxamine 5'-phosphate oxidase
MRLTQNTINQNPFEQFKIWYAEATNTALKLPNAVSLATVTTDGQPSSRMVLLKDFDEQGFVFYTNYQSNKAIEMRSNSCGALNFWWEPLHKQIRIEGRIKKVAAELSESYFATRPRESQIGAYASDQSKIVADAEFLEQQYERYEKEFAGKAITRPEHWGGYRMVPDMFEFWQGQTARMHDRIRFIKQGKRWVIQRLAP